MLGEFRTQVAGERVTKRERRNCFASRSVTRCVIDSLEVTEVRSQGRSGGRSVQELE